MGEEVSSDRGPQWTGEMESTEAGHFISPDPRTPVCAPAAASGESFASPSPVKHLTGVKEVCMMEKP